MAVTMVIGNTPQIKASLFASGYTLASVIANEFTEAPSDLAISALISLGLILLVVTILLNAAARLMILYLNRNIGQPGGEMNATHHLRKVFGRAMEAVCLAAAVLAMIPLFAFLWQLFAKGAGSITITLFTQLPLPPGRDRRRPAQRHPRLACWWWAWPPWWASPWGSARPCTCRSSPGRA